MGIEKANEKKRTIKTGRVIYRDISIEEDKYNEKI